MTEEPIFPVEQPAAPALQSVIRGLLEEAVNLERKAKELSDQASELKKQQQAKEASIVKHLTDHNMTSMKWDDEVMVIRVKKSHPSVPSDCKEKFKQWLRRNGYWGMAQVPTNSIKALLKERIEQELPVPDYLTTFEENTITVRNKNHIGRKLAPPTGQQQQTGGPF